MEHLAKTKAKNQKIIKHLKSKNTKSSIKSRLAQHQNP